MTTWKYFTLIFFLILSRGVAFSQSETPPDLFLQATQYYSQKDYKKAQEAFTKILDQNPENPTLITNLALSEFKLNNKFKAVGLLRKALSLDPDLPVAQSALSFALSQIQVKEVPHQNEPYEIIRKFFLLPVAPSTYLILTALTLFSSGWIWLSFAGRRRRAIEEEKSLPETPWIGVFLGVLFVTFTGLIALKLYDLQIVRGTIIEEKVALQTAPGENQVVILDLYGGMEVITRQTESDWVQVTYPGSLTGWIKKSSLLMTR